MCVCVFTVLGQPLFLKIRRERVYRLAGAADGRGRPLRRIWVGGRSSDSRGGANLLATLTDGRPIATLGACVNVEFKTSFGDADCVSGVSPRLRLLFELPDERLCNDKCMELGVRLSKCPLKCPGGEKVSPSTYGRRREASGLRVGVGSARRVPIVAGRWPYQASLLYGSDAGFLPHRRYGPCRWHLECIG